MSGSSKDLASECVEEIDIGSASGNASSHLRDLETEEKYLHSDSENLPDTQPLSPNLSLSLPHKQTSSQESNSQNESILTRDGSRHCSDSSFNKSKSLVESHTSSNFESPIITSASVLASTPCISKRIEVRQLSSHKRKLESSDHTPSKRQNLSVEIVYDLKKHENRSQEVIVISDSDKSDGSVKLVSSDDSRLFNKPALPTSVDNSLETYTRGIRDKPDIKTGGHIKQYHERLNSIITFTVDEKKHEIISVSINQINMCEESVSTVSSSSDTGSVCSTGLLPLPTSRLSTLSVTSTSSSSTSGLSSVVARNAAPVGIQIPSKLMNYKLPENCVCTCYCSAMFNKQTRKSNDSPCPHKIIINSSNEISKSKLETEEEMDVVIDDKNEKEDIKMESSETLITESVQPTEKLPLCEDIALSESRGGLLVFARWPGNTYFYPGIVEGVNGKYWQENFYLKVKFCDNVNMTKKITSTNVFPAHFIKPDATVFYKDENNEFDSYTVISVDRTQNCTRKRKIPLSYKIRNEKFVKDVAFEKIIVPKSTYKKLKSKILSSLTSRAKGLTSSNICHENIQEGKRQRFSSSVSAKNTPASKVQYSLQKTTSSTVKKLSGSGSPTCVSSSVDCSVEMDTSTKTDLKSSYHHMNSRGEFSGTTKVCCTDRQQCSGISEEYSSEQDVNSQNERLNLNEMCGEGLDVEYLPPSAKKTVGLRKPKSSSRTLKMVPEDESLIKMFGPIPNSPIFKGFNYVLTHTRETQAIPVEKPYEGTDFEGYYNTDVPFDAIRLKNQITAGGGTVYDFVTDIPADEQSKTIVISDKACRTPNYLFAVVNKVARFRHDLIVECCIENKAIGQLIPSAAALPYGWSNGEWIWSRKKKLLEHYTCILAAGGNINSLKLWQRLMEDAGFQVTTVKKLIQDLGGLPIIFDSCQSVLVANEDTPKEDLPLLSMFKENDKPVVSFNWVIESILCGEPRGHNLLPEYSVNFSIGS